MRHDFVCGRTSRRWSLLNAPASPPLCGLNESRDFGERLILRDFERVARDFGSGHCQAQPKHCREGLLPNEVAGGKKRDCGLFAVLRNDCASCTARPKIEDGVSLIALS